MLDKQFGACRRAMQRDKGPEVRAKEVKLDASMHNAWDSENYAWAVTWMLRAIEAANVKAKDVMVKTDSKVVRLNVRKSKTDQKGVGTWRTLRCCGLEECKRDCPFDLTIRALKDLKGATADTPLFSDSKGGPVSKIHMVTAWTKHIDEEMTGHSARRSGAMKYARQGMSVQAIQFLGRWKSSAVFRYIEEAMTEIPMNTTTDGMELESKSMEASPNKRVLRPKSSASAKKARKEDNSPESQPKHLVDEPEKGPAYAVSRSRGTWTKHVVGQASWGIPLDSWATICGWNFARRNVKVELTQRPSGQAKELQIARNASGY